MILLRRVIGDALRARRQGQHRTLREVSSAANVSLGYLSEIERGQKEASSELLAAICAALGARLSELLREVSDTMALAEQMSEVLIAVPEQPVSGENSPASIDAARSGAADPTHATLTTPTGRRTGRVAVRQVASDGTVSVAVHQESPLRTTLRATRRVATTDPHRDVVCAA